MSNPADSLPQVQPLSSGNTPPLSPAQLPADPSHKMESQPPPLSSTSAPLVNSPLPPVDPASGQADSSLKAPMLLPKGFEFHPTDEELVLYYLKRKVQNRRLNADFIGEVDVYKYEPWDLPPQARIPSDSQWYFFSRSHSNYSNRSNRATEKGYWKATGKDRGIQKDRKVIGMKKTFVYYSGRPPSRTRTDWIMHEYRQCQLENKETSKDSHVLLRLFKKTVPNDVEKRSSLAMDSQQVDEVLEPLQISSLVDGSLIYGRENYKRDLLNFILSHVFNDSNPIVTCIVAASGYGKSTMLHLLYNDQSVRDAFDKKVFLCISERFDERRLMKEVLQSLTCSSHDIYELSILEDIVKEELMEKKLLLVLDNAENQNRSFWNYVSILINAGAKGSLSLVTKQSQMVGDVMEGMHIHHLNDLSYYHCWAILKHHAFGGCDRNVSPVLEEIGKTLLSKCNYNPLCIRVLGALLRNAVNEDWWIDILGSKAWETTYFGGDILPALRVCYDYLPTHLKNCFSYCSLFPRDYVFPKHYIIRLWISQGFIVPLEGRELEEIGVQYFDELVERSFFQHFPVDNANRDKFVMHELIHCLAENVSCDSCFRSEDGICSIPDVSHFSLASSEPQTIQLEHLVKEVRDLHTCLFVNRSKFQTDGVFPIVTLVGLNDLFRTFSSITALDLSYTNVAELPDSIGLLQGLRFLGINNTKVEHLPRELFSLVNIRTIEARNCGRLFELPEEISHLTNLRYLDVWKESGHVLMPLGIGKLINLQNLETFNIGNDSLQANVGELKSLNSLRSHLRITGLENVGSIDEAVEATLKNKSKIEALKLQWSGSVQYGRGEADVAFTEELLKNLKPNGNLEELIVQNYTGAQFPAWIGDPLFSKLVSVILDSCLNCKKFPDLSELPSLRCLSLRKMRGVRKLIDSAQRSLMKRFPVFQSLELLNLWEMYDLEELFETEDGDFPHLRTISINRCSVLRKVPRFPSLVELSFHSCARLPEIANLPSLEFLKVENFGNMKELYLPAESTKLKRLELSYCSELLSVEGLLKMTSIEKILLTRCPQVDLLHNLEKYNFKRVNVTRLRQEMHRLDGDMPVDDVPRLSRPSLQASPPPLAEHVHEAGPSRLL